MERIQSLMAFLDNAHSVFHAVAGLETMLQAQSYTQLQEVEDWQLLPGGKYYVKRGGSAIVAFRIPEGAPAGFLITSSHADRPAFKIKENGELTGTYTRLGVERYGGMLIAPWLDRPLSVAGRVLVETENGVQSRLVDIDRDLLLIPNVAIHMNRKANDGYTWNLAVDTLPLMGSKAAAGKFWQLLEEQAGGKILGNDLYLYIRQKASCWGVDKEYFSAQAIDDLECAWCCTQGFLEAKQTRNIPVLSVFDSEEAGSASYSGAAADFLQSVLLRICGELGLQAGKRLARSFMVSADNAHAVHPNHPEYADGANAPEMNGGVVVKFAASQSYTSDGVSAAVFRKICANAGVPVQTYCNRADLPGGSTLGRVSLAQVAVPSVDIGLAQLAMHSCYETAGVKDASYLVDAMAAYYGTTLEMPADGVYNIL